MSGEARGRRLELEVAKALRSDGWVVGSLRHTQGGGDLIASRLLDRHEVFSWQSEEPSKVIITAEVRLIEVKATSRPFERFSPADREAMRMVAKRAGASAWLAWCPKGESLIAWYREDQWPPDKSIDRAEELEEVEEDDDADLI